MRTMSMLVLTLGVAVTGSPAQQVPVPAETAREEADTAARVNAEARAQASAQSAGIRKSQDDYARAQAVFARDQAAYEDARRRNDVERAQAAAAAAAYQRDLVAWRAKVAEVEAHNAGRAPRASRNEAVTARARVVCTDEAPIGSRISQRVCRSVDATKDGAEQVRDMRDSMRATSGCRPAARC